MDPDKESPATPPRERTLSQRGQEQYELQTEKYLDKLRKLKRDIDSYISEIDVNNLPADQQQVEHIRKEVLDRFLAYEQESSRFTVFLQGTRTKQSCQEESGHCLIAQSVRMKIDIFISAIDEHLQSQTADNTKETEKTQLPTETKAEETDKTQLPTETKAEKPDKTQFPTETKPEKSDSDKPSLKVKSEKKSTVQSNRISKKASVKPRSMKSRRSLESFTSHASAMLVNEQVKLEAARVRLKYTAKEQELAHQKSILNANIERLEREREVEEAETKVRAIQEALQGSGEDDATEHSDVSKNFVFNRTEQFVTQDTYERFKEQDQSTDNNEAEQIETIASVHAAFDDNYNGPNTIQYLNFHENTHPLKSDRLINTGRDENENKIQNFDHDTITKTKQDNTLNVSAPVFIPSSKEMNMCDEFSRFLVRKEIVSSRLSKFDDQPDMFIAWKSMFENIVQELRLTAAEEVDLLVKWLGPSSSRQALIIRSANASNPEKCRDRIWERLEDRFGRPEMVENTIKHKIESFQKITNRDYRPLFDLSDIVEEINSVMDNPRYQPVFAHFNSSSGVNQIVTKLPHNLQEKWTQEANKYKTRTSVIYPPFRVFAKFISDMAKLRNDPSFHYEASSEPNNQQRARKTGPVHVSARITGSKESATNSPRSQATNPSSRQNTSSHQADTPSCPLHGTSHTLNMCRAFRLKPIAERKEFLKKNGLCYRCCGPKRHLSTSCTETVKCIVCKSSRHPSALHVDVPKAQDISETSKPHGGEATIGSACTQVCGSNNGMSKSCAKIALVNVFPKDNPANVRKVYCLIDDQSNRSLATTQFFNEFQESGIHSEYVLSTCSGQFTTAGRRAKNYVIESYDHTNQLLLPEIIECDEIPNNRHEIPSQDLARKFEHLKDIAEYIEPIHEDVSIELLIGRDLISAHHVLDQRIGQNGLPYGQKLPLGWVILGETCLGKVHCPDVVHVKVAHILENGRATLFKPCEYDLQLKSDNIFVKTPHDESIGLSIEDKEFLHIMDSNFERDQDGQWVAPLPFLSNRQPLRSNRSLALKRARSFDYSLSKDEKKAKHVTDFMQRMLDNKHCEKAPTLKSGEEHWYLPVFGVYHPRKPESIRLVFDSSSKFENQSLNDVLLKGPDLTNKLLGILLNFRKEKVAITCDVEQMFYNFKVREDHRNFLLFLWHEQNDLTKPLTDFRMNVHVFGNRPSPAIATYGFRKTVENEKQDVRDFVNEHFYVDDGLISCQNINEAASLIKHTQAALWDGGKMRLHKIASNSTELLEQFDSSDLAKGLKDLDLSSDELPTQRSLGVSWDIRNDVITFQISTDVKPFTRRGALSTINSIYDPVGFAAPVVIRGKLLLREMMGTSVVNWDDMLSDSYLDQWEAWVTSLKGLETLRIPRMYTSLSFVTANLREIHIFCDASKQAIGAVAYLKLSDGKSTEISFVMGKAKVAPSSGHTIPRLELCGAVLAVEMADTIKEQLKIETENMYFYTDSQVVLGYINNTSRRFYVYVCNRISRIHASSDPRQWRYVTTDMNPADLATRSVQAANLQDTMWFHGPAFLKQDNIPSTTEFALVNPEKDQEVRPEIQTLKTSAGETESFESISNRFDRFSIWRRLVSAINVLRNRIKSIKSDGNGTYKPTVVDQLQETERFIIRQVQFESFEKEIESIACGDHLPRNSTIRQLNPFLDKDGILRVKGRIKHSELTDSCKQPIIIPKGHHIAVLLTRYYHAKVAHQGRSFTEAAIRNAGYWIIGVKRLINSVLRKCVICKKLRGKACVQQMADLPKDRVTPSPPFSFVGIDAFGPWPVTFRRTRGGVAQSKRWALIFACLVTRAIHLEVIEELSSSSFINAWRRFIALRGPVQQVRSDRGTNFIGATQDLSMIAQFVENQDVKNFLDENRITWLFNPPHASHFGGAWERLIGVSRRVLDSLLLENRFKDLTHEMLTTFLAEVTAIVNNRPLTSVSYDSESPVVLTPSLLLTQKTCNDIAPFPDFQRKEAIKNHWKYVQFLAQQFWTKWRQEYLHSLQIRPKWQTEEPNVREGTVVLMKDNDCARNYWPIGIIDRIFPSEDGKVRKVEIRIVREGQPVRYVRPISQIVLLVEPE